MLVLWSAAVTTLCLWLLLRGGGEHVNVFHVGGGPVPVAVDYKDFVTILLTAVAVMIAIGTIALAGLAVFGYAEGRRMVETIVRQAVRDTLGPAIFRAREDATGRTPPTESNRIASEGDDQHAL